MATFEKRGDYQWRAKVRRSGHRTQSATFESRRKAEQWARDIESKMDRGVFQDQSRAEQPCLGQLLVRYSREITSEKKGWRHELSKLRVIGRSRLANMPLAKIQGQDIAQYKEERLKAVQNKTVRDELVLLSHLFKVASLEWGYHLPTNPADQVRKPKVNNRRNRRLLPGEEPLLLEAAHQYGHPLPAIIEFALETAMQRGELARLT